LKERLGLVDDASIEVLGTEEQNVQTYSSSASADSGMLLGAAPLLRKSSVESDVQTVNPIGGPVRSKYVFGATSRNASRGRLPRKDQMQQLVDERVVQAVTERFDADVNSRIESTVNESVQTAVSAEVNAQLQVALEGQHDPDCRRCMPWDEIDAGVYKERIEEVKKLITLRKTHGTFKSRNFHFPNDVKDKRAIEYMKLMDDEVIKVVLNCGEDPVEVAIGGEEKILYARKYAKKKLLPKGVVIYRM
jgi:hypothetical protein